MPQRIGAENFVKIGPAVPEICLRADRLTDTQRDSQTDRSGVIIIHVSRISGPRLRVFFTSVRMFCFRVKQCLKC